MFVEKILIYGVQLSIQNKQFRPEMPLSSFVRESLIWDIRRRLAQRAIPTNATLVLPVSMTIGGGPYVELSLIYAFPFV